MTTIEQMVQREVLCCMSSLVSTLAQGYADPKFGPGTQHIIAQMEALRNLCEQASELAAPVLDYEEAAIQFGYELRDWSEPLGGGKVWSSDKHVPVHMRDAEEVCAHHNLDPIDREVYEHWAVTQWFAERLAEHGERVDTNFAGLHIWARTTTGQAISMDGCIQRIYTDMMKTK